MPFRSSGGAGLGLKGVIGVVHEVSLTTGRFAGDFDSKSTSLPHRRRLLLVAEDVRRDQRLVPSRRLLASSIVAPPPSARDVHSHGGSFSQRRRRGRTRATVLL